ncbi:MAG TPA: DUF4245 domain-containing protein [Geodermatophilus sp.]|nr:DUF4245 domain-containing protein [Geodermatophilus sp.]
MTAVDPSSQRPQQTSVEIPPSPAAERAARFTAANMLRSLLPLVVICLVLVGWNAFRTTPDDPVREVDPTSTVQLAAARAGYPVLAPSGLPEGYRPTSARTDAGGAQQGDPVTLELGYLTPSEEFAGFVVSDNARAAAVTSVLEDAEEQGTVELDGEVWTRSTTGRGETALSRQVDGVTVLVTGSAPDEELETVATAVEPYSG